MQRGSNCSKFRATDDRAPDLGLSALTKGTAMRKLSPGESRCAICHALLPTNARPKRPIVVVTSRGGEPTDRVVTLAGSEIHRCPFPEVHGKARRVA